MLALDVWDAQWIWFEEWIAIDVWEDGDLSVGAFAKEGAHLNCVFRPPINSHSGGTESLQLRHVVVGANDSFD